MKLLIETVERKGRREKKPRYTYFSVKPDMLISVKTIAEIKVLLRITNALFFFFKIYAIFMTKYK